MKFATVEVVKQPLSRVLVAFERATGVRFLVDHNGLAVTGKDIDSVIIDLPEKRSTYKTLIDRALRNVQLRGELRIDEAGQPIYWIFPARRPAGAARVRSR